MREKINRGRLLASVRDLYLRFNFNTSGILQPSN